MPLSARCFLIGKGGQDGQVRQFSGCCEADFGPHWTANQLYENRKLPNLSFLPSLADWELINYYFLDSLEPHSILQYEYTLPVEREL